MSFDWGFATGEGVSMMKLRCAPVVPGSVVIFCRDGINDKSISDLGNGQVYGDGIGVIDYELGWVAISFFGVAPVPGTPIIANYDPIEGGCSDSCGKCATSMIKLSVTPGQVSGSDQFTMNDAWSRLFLKIKRDILPIHAEILSEVSEEYYVVSVATRFDTVSADSCELEHGLHVSLDDVSW